MQTEPQEEHRWLNKLVGEWTCEGECVMAPGEPPMTWKGVESVRSLGGLWTMGEGEGEMPGGGTSTSIMTLGYDPAKKSYVGSFIASVMTHLWVYQGTVDDAKKRLTLDTEGPSFAGDGMAKYQDCIEFVDDDHRILTSQVQDEKGEWNQFMTAHYYRKK